MVAAAWLWALMLPASSKRMIPSLKRGDDRLVALLGGTAAGLGLACVGEFGAHDDPAGGLRVVVDQRVDRHQHVDRRAVLAVVGVLAASRMAALSVRLAVTTAPMDMPATSLSVQP